MNKNLPIALVPVDDDVLIEYNKYSYLYTRYENAIAQIKKRGIPDKYQELYKKLVYDAAKNRMLLETYAIYIRTYYLPQEHKFKYFAPSLANHGVLIYPYPDRKRFYETCFNQN